MNEKLKEKIRESLSSVLPITMIVLILSITLVPMEISTLVLFLTGAVLLIVGMGFFQLGAEMAMTPLGQGVGGKLVKFKSVWMMALICFLMGAIITISEPDLQVLANQVAAVPNMVLIWTVAAGVGIFTVIALLRILFKIRLSLLLAGLYIFMFILSFLTPSEFIAVAFDAGGVTTGPMTVPFIMALGVGLSAARSDKDGSNDSFGLIALCSVGPILMVLLLGIFYHPTEAAYTAVEIPRLVTTQDVVREFAKSMPDYAGEVLRSILPVVGVFLIFQIFARSYRKRQVQRMAVGFGYTVIGLIMFLTGVNIGFAPVGSLLGGGLADSIFKWLLVPVGIIIGYYIVKAEPAVRVLNEQVEEITGGMVSYKMMNASMSIGVACAVALSMTRVLTGISIYWIIIPGYALALILSRLVPPVFVGIAFDSGGVASGPMTSTFLLPLAMGACTALGGNVVTDAFGIVALVALAPLIAIQVMGLVYERRTKAVHQPSEGLSGDAVIDLEDTIVDLDDTIVDLEDTVVDLEED
ncbi:MAG: DUF1538 domain-containing protein [Lachnospiraceae bacterium]|nr:DUF1538 domain-containing protein [Lachnospiraceae bacterium]